MRRKTPNYGLLWPWESIKVAEDTALIVPIGERSEVSDDEKLTTAPPEGLGHRGSRLDQQRQFLPDLRTQG